MTDLCHKRRTDEVLPTHSPALTNTQLRCDMADLSFILQDESIKAKFWQRVDMRAPSECWNWVGTKSRGGYGRLKVMGHTIAAHRFSLMVAIGRCINSHEFACHTCDNPVCVNPKHLYVGNHKTNTADMVARNRSVKWEGKRRGQENPRAKLNIEDIHKIRFMHFVVPIRKIASQFSINKSTVCDIIYKRSWTNV